VRTRTPSGNEDNMVRCKRCGFPCDSERDKTGAGEGLTYVAVTHTASTCPDDPTVVSGCPFCGTRNYDKWAQ
jgi:hypothetical protein